MESETPIPTVPEAAPAPAPAAAPVAPEPTSTPSAHVGSLNGPLPAELHGFNWGAFFLTWIWGIGHNVWISLLALIVPFPIMSLVLGFKGNEWAWEHRKFESVEQFKKVQKVWMYWGLGFFIAGLLILFMTWSLLISLFIGGALNSEDFNNSLDNQNTDLSVPQDSQLPGYYTD